MPVLFSVLEGSDQPTSRASRSPSSPTFSDEKLQGYRTDLQLAQMHKIAVKWPTRLMVAVPAPLEPNTDGALRYCGDKIGANAQA